jgi:hypothetical protein
LKAAGALSPERKKQLHEIYFEIEHILRNNSKNLVTPKTIPETVEDVFPANPVRKTSASSSSSTFAEKPVKESFFASIKNAVTKPVASLMGSTVVANEKSTPTTPTATPTPTTASPTTPAQDDFGFFDTAFPAVLPPNKGNLIL